MKFIKSSPIFALAVLSVSPSAHATYNYSASIVEMAMTGEWVPGLGATFTSFSAPTTDRDMDFSTGIDPYWFIASTSNGTTGVYVYDAYYHDFSDLADTSMVAPTGGNFASFSNLTSGQGVAGFIGTDTNGNQGIYGIGDLPLTLIATPNTSSPSGGILGNIQAISMTGESYGNPSGTIQSESGVYNFIAGSSPPSLGSLNYESLTSLGPVSYKAPLDNSIIPGIAQFAFAFTAYSQGVQGVYSANPTSSRSSGYTEVAAIGQILPSGNGHFTIFGNPYVTANEVAFTAHYTTNGSDDQQGIFVYGGYISGGNPLYPTPALSQIVATGQVAPNSHGATFTGFSDISDSSYDTTFLASLSDGNEGLYVNVDPNPPYIPEQIIKVIETGDILDGKTIDGISLASDASNLFDTTQDASFGYTNVGIGFEVDFTDGSEGLYYFTVSLPEPGLFCLLPLSTLLFRRRR